MEKECFKCKKKKSRAEFYRHSRMGDGLLGKCKECTKADVAKHRFENLEKIRAYDRGRGNRQTQGYRDERKRRFPQKYKANSMVSNAVRDGKLFKEPCEECGAEENVHAHHNDYAKPLNVRWLCAAHHQQWHANHGEAKNGG